MEGAGGVEKSEVCDRESRGSGLRSDGREVSRRAGRECRKEYGGGGVYRRRIRLPPTSAQVT